MAESGLAALGVDDVESGRSKGCVLQVSLATDSDFEGLMDDSEL